MAGVGADLGQQVQNASMDEMLEALAMGVAEAQLLLDEKSSQIALIMSGVNAEDRVNFASQTYSLMDLGFTPTFYEFTGTIFELKVAVHVHDNSTEQTGNPSLSIRFPGRKTISTAMVNANYSQKYDYHAEGASIMRTNLVPTPAPGTLQERLQTMREVELNPDIVIEDEEGSST